MKKVLKRITLTLSITVLAIGAVIGSIFGADAIAGAIDKKNNTFDINKSGFLALSYQKKDKKGNEKNNYRYISTKMQYMNTDDPFTSDPYENYYIDLNECFNVENMDKYTLIKKEVKDKEDNPIPYNEKYDPIFDFVTHYSHNIMDDIQLYDLGKAVVITYMPNVVLASMNVEYFSPTFQNDELVQIDIELDQPLSGIKLYTVL